MCSSLAEHYGLPTWSVRFIAVSAILAQPLCILFYLLLWLSIPRERAVVGCLQGLRDAEADANHFQHFASVLLTRVGVRTDSNRQSYLAAIAMLGIALLIQLPRVQGNDFYFSHPFLAVAMSTASRFATLVLYISIAVAFYVNKSEDRTSVELRIKRLDRVWLDVGPFREITGLTSGVARVTGVQPAFLRCLFAFLNIVTLGIGGVLYFVAVGWVKHKGRILPKAEIEPAVAASRRETPRFGPVSRNMLVRIFVLLAVMRALTELRIFFFNEPFFQGILLIIAGVIATWSVISAAGRNGTNTFWLIAGSAAVLLGIYELSTAAFEVQLSLPESFAVAFFGAGLSLLYFTLVGVRRNRGSAILLVAFLLLSAVLSVWPGLPSRYLVSLVQFYDFFYPILFAGFGFWLVLER